MTPITTALRAIKSAKPTIRAPKRHLNTFLALIVLRSSKWQKIFQVTSDFIVFSQFDISHLHATFSELMGQNTLICKRQVSNYILTLNKLKKRTAITHQNPQGLPSLRALKKEFAKKMLFSAKI